VKKQLEERAELHALVVELFQVRVEGREGTNDGGVVEVERHACVVCRGLYVFRRFCARAAGGTRVGVARVEGMLDLGEEQAQVAADVDEVAEVVLLARFAHVLVVFLLEAVREVVAHELPLLRLLEEVELVPQALLAPVRGRVGDAARLGRVVLALEDEEELVHVLPERALLLREGVVLAARLRRQQPVVVVVLLDLDAAHRLVEVVERRRALLAREPVLAALADHAAVRELVLLRELLVRGRVALRRLRQRLGQAGLEEEVALPDAHARGWRGGTYGETVFFHACVLREASKLHTSCMHEPVYLNSPWTSGFQFRTGMISY